jgi:ketosteroid isomerase-like protein
VSEENVAIIKAIFEADATTSKDEILQALPNLIPAPFHPDAEWAEAPDHVDAKTYRGHDGILESFEQRLDQWDGRQDQPVPRVLRRGGCPSGT